MGAAPFFMVHSSHAESLASSVSAQSSASAGPLRSEIIAGTPYHSRNRMHVPSRGRQLDLRIGSFTFDRISLTVCGGRVTARDVPDKLRDDLRPLLACE